MLCVFDCESVPDVRLLREIYEYDGSDLEVCEMAFAKQKEATGSEFLPIAFHQIISISALICDDFGRFVKVGNFAHDSVDIAPNEREILGEFLRYLNKNNPK